MSDVERDSFGMYAVSDSDGPGPRLMGAKTLIGNDVYNTQDENLGNIKEIMLDVRHGRISYAVLSFGRIMGMGDKLFAAPWEALTLDVAKDRMEVAPGFNQDNWPNMADPTWAKDIHNHDGTQPYDQPTP